ncbi:MAG: hypothetical protein ACI86M_003540 [Saprospiraceae bacterium]|jgi:hypothetical protein
MVFYISFVAIVDNKSSRGKKRNQKNTTTYRCGGMVVKINHHLPHWLIAKFGHKGM